MNIEKLYSVSFKLFIIIILLNSSSIVIAQNTTVRESRQFQLSLQLFGPTSLGINADYFICNLVDFDLGVGGTGSFQSGIRIFPFEGKTNSAINSFIGLFFESINIPNLLGDGSERTSGFYVPLGFEWYFYKGLTLSFEVAYNKTAADLNSIPTNVINGAIRIGYRFLSK